MQAATPEAMTEFWNREDWTERRVGRRWYGAWARQYMYTKLLRAQRWAQWTRWLYHLGIVALLVGLTAIVWPPHHQWTAWRDLLLAVAMLGALSELCWIMWVALPVKDRNPGNDAVVGSTVKPERWRRYETAPFQEYLKALRERRRQAG